MSQCSIVEINHDMSFNLDQVDPATFVELLQRALASGSDDAWEPLRAFGIHRIVQCHHSEDRVAVIGSGVLRREYGIG